MNFEGWQRRRWLYLFGIFSWWLYIPQAFSKKYDLPSGWIITNSNNLTEMSVASNGAKYRLLVSVNGSVIQSDNGTFVLSFLNFNGTGQYYLSVMMQKVLNSSTAASTPVWIGNRNSTVSDGATLMLTQRHQKFILLTASGQLAWKTKEVGIAGIDLEESGNLIFYDNSSSVIWSSFNDPQNHILLPGNRFISGMSLTSTMNDDSGFLPGIYSAEMKASGLILFVNFVSQAAEPYFVWSLSDSLSVTSATKACGSSQAMMRYSAEKMDLFYNQSAGLSCPSAVESLQISSSNSVPHQMTFLRLQSDGNLVSYSLNSETMMWNPYYKIINNSCKLPMVCGKYGICEGDGKCKCVERGSNGSENIISSSNKCHEPKGTPALDLCEDEMNNHFFNITGASYFPAPYSIPQSSNSSLDQCLSLCLSNCSCSALFFMDSSSPSQSGSGSGSCFFADKIIGSLSIAVDGRSSAAFLKFENSKLRLLPPSPSSSRRSSLQMIVGITVAGALLLLLIFIMIRVGWKKKRKKSIEEEEMDSFLRNLHGLPQRFSYKSLEEATKGFTVKLGTGGFGSVYEGTLSDGRKLAVKKLEGNSNQGAKQFIAEVATIGSISHVNIVRLRGFCVESTHRILVYEYMPNGSLDRWIFQDTTRGTTVPQLSWRSRMEIAIGMARGLAYLHEECSEAIIHLDVKPQNILLDERMVAKVADFGMSKLLADRDVSHVVTGVRGTPGYLAPEWLLHSIATKKCDVYSYGMVLLELIGGRRNIDVSRMKRDLSWYFPAWAVNEVREGRIMGLVDPTVRDEVKMKEVSDVVHVAMWCIQENASVRPCMNRVVEMLEGRSDVVEPPLSFHFAVETNAIAILEVSSSSGGGGDGDGSKESVSLNYVTPPSFHVSSLIR